MQALGPQLEADAHQVLVALGVVDLNAGLGLCVRLLHALMQDHRGLHLLGDDIRNSRVPDRLKGVLAEHALRHRHLIDEVDAVPGHPVHLGERRQECQPVRSGGLHDRGQFRADVAPQRGIRLFINVVEAGVQSVPHRAEHHVVCFSGRQMPGLSIQNQHLDIVLCLLKVIGRIRHHHSHRATRCELNARIQSTGKVIRDH